MEGENVLDGAATTRHVGFEEPASFDDRRPAN
jgi:hypothetical protein